jgi:hypothetical protein
MNSNEVGEHHISGVMAHGMKYPYSSQLPLLKENLDPTEQRLELYPISHKWDQANYFPK